MTIDTLSRPVTCLEAAPFTLADPELTRLYDYWRGIRHGRPVPLRRDFDPVDIPYLLGNVMLVEVLDRPRRYFVRVHGTEIARRVGFELSRRMLDDLPVPEYRDPAIAHFERVARTGLPHRAMNEMVADHHVLRFEAVLLPLSRDGARSDMLLAGLHFLTAREIASLGENVSREEAIAL
jgi:hypothetical protein